jgi:hypothetical protein
MPRNNSKQRKSERRQQAVANLRNSADLAFGGKAENMRAEADRIALIDASGPVRRTAERPA